MDIILPKKTKKAVHPVVIFKEGWDICRRNLRGLSVIYLIFNLPFVVFYLTPLGDKFQKQELNPWSTLLIFFLFFIISFWGYIALLLGAKQVVESNVCMVEQNIARVKTYFFRYLGAVLASSLFLVCMAVLGGTLSFFVLKLLLNLNRAVAVFGCLLLAIITFAFLMYFMFRWSLAPISCILEGCRPIAALKRSLALVNDYVHPLAGTFCLAMLTYIVCITPLIIFGSVFELIKDPDQFNQIGTIYSIFINIILAPFWTTVTVLLYKKLKEALEANVYA